MKSKLIKLAIVSFTILLLSGSITACASSQVALNKQPGTTQTPTPTSPTTQAPATTKSPALGSKQAGDLTVSLSSNPNPPIRGNNTLEAVVTDAKGQPISNATVSFDIDMTNMSHGKNVINASSLGDGHYSGNIFFLMPGPWRVIISIERGGQTDTVRFDFNVNWR